jgi:predicted nucleic acid-binding protein
MATNRMVIDTNIFIEHLRAKDKSKTNLMQIPADAELFVSAVTFYELLMGATSEEKEKEVSILIDAIPILPFSDEVARKAADIYHDLRKRNRMIGFRDIFIAATALAHDLPVKTNNRKDFERVTGLVLI